MRFLYNIAILVLIVNSAFAQTSGLSFLKIGVGGRATGMAEAYTAVANDASATYWNPAGLMNAKKKHISFTHNKWLQDINSEYIAFVLPKEKQAFGFSLNSTNISGIEFRDDRPSVQPIGTFDAHDLALGVSYARSLRPYLDWGVTIKYVYEKIYVEETSGIAGDFGLNYHFSKFPVKLALVLQNVGFMAKLKNEAPALPHVLRFGVSYIPTFSFLTGSWTFAGDFVSDLENRSHVSLGTEYFLKKFFALRFGYQSGFELKNSSFLINHFGFGLISGRFLLDYGYVPIKLNFGQGHRLTFGIKF